MARKVCFSPCRRFRRGTKYVSSLRVEKRSRNSFSSPLGIPFAAQQIPAIALRVGNISVPRRLNRLLSAQDCIGPDSLKANTKLDIASNPFDKIGE